MEAAEIASVTRSVKVLVPVPVGVPEIVPRSPDKINPDGSAPETMLHRYGLVPPVAASAAVYAVFCVAAGNEVVVTASAPTTAALMVMLRALLAVCELLPVTCTVNVLVPVPVGVPEITPVLVTRVSPSGSDPEAIDQL